ncbi:MAG TPA: small acid-soluble spore protein SspI [Acholeplasmataceae bacterium]|jgi:small acid-soluble spore protein I (minor)|nr:small acid-soluble spore protein SspI [Acholeplasmataceae bacterium]
MNLDIRQAVKNNLVNASNIDVLNTINDAMTISEEKVLPGLGVLFELYWQGANDEERNRIALTIANSMRQ